MLTRTASRGGRRSGLLSTGPRSGGRMRSRDERDFLRRMLLQRRSEAVGVLRRQDVFGPRRRDALHTDICDGASAAAEQYLDGSVREVRSGLIAEIDRALKKLDEATYGTCEECGQAIAPARLRAIPWASHCVICQSFLEHETRGAFS